MDTQEKYEKLTNDFAKLRVQAQVLKKGVLEEQSKNSNLVEELKEYEKKVRKSDLEMESLNFRNQQLMKRIAVLQDELENTPKTKNKNHLKKNVVETKQNNVVDEELTMKIMENAQLSSKLYDKDLEISNLQNKLEKIEIELELKYKSQINELTEKLKELDREKVREQNDSEQNHLDSHTIVENSKVLVEVNVDYKEKLGISQNEILKLTQQIENLNAQLILGGNYSRTHHLDLDELSLEDDVQKDCLDQTSLCFFKRINQLVFDKNILQSAYDNLTIEYNSLEMRLSDCIKEKLGLDERLRVTEEAFQHMQEELTTTCHNYDQQLSSMSDHLANMNLTLSNQCDEINQLKYQLKQKSK